jgi:hypothetical protein
MAAGDGAEERRDGARAYRARFQLGMDGIGLRDCVREDCGGGRPSACGQGGGANNKLETFLRNIRILTKIGAVCKIKGFFFAN